MENQGDMSHKPIVTDLLNFLGDSPTPYHAVHHAVSRLRSAQFTALSELDAWGALAPGRYYVEWGDSALAAFVVPEGTARGGFRIVGAHTDSPNLRLKPRPEYCKEGYLQLGVEVYGGALLNSWLDRDLGVAGRVLLHTSRGFETSLVLLALPLARVTQLAIHLDREVNEKGLVLNKQTHMAPILGLASELPSDVLKSLCAERLGVSADSIAHLDLMLYDLCEPSLGGLQEAFLFSGRLDNLAMSHAAIWSLIDAATDSNEQLPLAVLFDHEEVGSSSATGAGSGWLPRLLERISLGLGSTREQHLQRLASSLCLSADMAHAVHPNYADRHEPSYKPQLNRGPVIKVNTQQRYATCARTAALFEQLCKQRGIPVQTYVHRTDLACGSTIGPITSTLLGMPTVDVGNPMLSMHSAREMAGSHDPAWMAEAMRGFYSTSMALAEP
jgi:aspartyl aminopeptidase